MAFIGGLGVWKQETFYFQDERNKQEFINTSGTLSCAAKKIFLRFCEEKKNYLMNLWERGPYDAPKGAPVSYSIFTHRNE